MGRKGGGARVRPVRPPGRSVCCCVDPALTSGLDLTPIFDAWNTKQVFLYLTAEYDDKPLQVGTALSFGLQLTAHRGTAQGRPLGQDRQAPEEPKDPGERRQEQIRVERGIQDVQVSWRLASRLHVIRALERSLAAPCSWTHPPDTLCSEPARPPALTGMDTRRRRLCHERSVPAVADTQQGTFPTPTSPCITRSCRTSAS